MPRPGDLSRLDGRSELRPRGSIGLGCIRFGELGGPSAQEERSVIDPRRHAEAIGTGQVVGSVASRLKVGMAALLTLALALAGAAVLRAGDREKEGCTVIGVGRLATVDGSVITSHTDCCSECRIQIIPGRTFPKGAMAPVHWGMVYFGAEDDRKALPLGDFGKVIGEIPQVEKTFAYFHTGYSQMNERQLAIGESTCSEKPELDVPYVEGITRQIMTVEQAQVFALERCATAREAVRLIAGLMEKYGFLPSCGGSEALCIADPKELWEMEICGVGAEWTPESGKPGAIWTARRVPDDNVVVVANHFRIREIDLKEPGCPGFAKLRARSDRPRLVRPEERPAVHLARGLFASDSRRKPEPDVADLQHHRPFGKTVAQARTDGGGRPGDAFRPTH